MILQTNINVSDALYKGLLSHYNEAELELAIQRQVEEYLCDLRDAKECDEILRKIRSGEEETVPFEDILRENGLAD